MIFLNVKNFQPIWSSKKLNYKYYDSYWILKFVEKISYKFQLFNIINEIHDVFHVSLLEFYKKKFDNVVYFCEWKKN